MNDKDKLIIKAAITLFAQKGFASTSIQEIATESGISKGAFYLHFKSKEALLLAILNHYFEQLQRNVSAIENKNLSPREKFIMQLTVLYENLIEHKEFIIMQSREQAIPLNESVKELIYKMHIETHQFYRQGLLEIYGANMEPFLWDLALMLDGLFHAYMRLLLFDNTVFNINELTHYMMRRIDTIVEGLRDDQPILSEGKMDDLLNKSKAFFFKDSNKIKQMLMEMKKMINTMDNKEDLEVSLEVLEAELNRETPRVAVIQGMLSNFKDITEFDSFRKEISTFYHVKM